MMSVCVYQASLGSLTKKGLVRALLKPPPPPIRLLVLVLPFADRVRRNFLRIGGKIFGPKRTPRTVIEPTHIPIPKITLLVENSCDNLSTHQSVIVWITMYARAHIRRHIFFVSLKLFRLIFRVLIATMIKQVPSTPL